MERARLQGLDMEWQMSGAELGRAHEEERRR